MLNWLPDWKIKQNYPDAKSASKEQLAWEFLRRSPAYQKDYRRIRKMPGIDEMVKYANDTNFQKYYKTKPPMLPNETYNEFTERCKKEQLEVSSVRDDLLEDYGISEYSKQINPASNTPPKFSDYYPYSPKFRKSGTLTQYYSDEVLMTFSLTVNLDMQLKAAKKILLQRRKYLPRSNQKSSNNLYIRYLRILDAKASKIPETEISRIIFNTADKSNSIINSGYKAGLKLRDGGYKTLSGVSTNNTPLR